MMLMMMMMMMMMMMTMMMILMMKKLLLKVFLFPQVLIGREVIYARLFQCHCSSRNHREAIFISIFLYASHNTATPALL